MRSDAANADEYLESLPDDRRAAIAAVRDVVLANLPPGYEEGMEYGMISYHIPLARYPSTYNGRPLGIAALANQKNYMALYLMGVYSTPEESAWFTDRWRASGKRLDMGKSCVRFKRLDDVALDVVGEAIARTTVDDCIAFYERSRRKE